MFELSMFSAGFERDSPQRVARAHLRRVDCRESQKKGCDVKRFFQPFSPLVSPTRHTMRSRASSTGTRRKLDDHRLKFVSFPSLYRFSLCAFPRTASSLVHLAVCTATSARERGAVIGSLFVIRRF